MTVVLAMVTGRRGGAPRPTLGPDLKRLEGETRHRTHESPSRLAVAHSSKHLVASPSNRKALPRDFPSIMVTVAKSTNPFPLNQSKPNALQELGREAFNVIKSRIIILDP